MEIQPGVKLVKNKLLYSISPIRRLYPHGLNLELLAKSGSTKREKLLTIYRNLVRMTRYLQVHTFHRKSLNQIYKIKLRQDYGYRCKALFGEEVKLEDDELYNRLINTVHFVHNACIDTLSNETKRPVSMEYKILTAIIQYEISKNLFPSLSKRLKSHFFKLDTMNDLRASERAWFMESIDEQLKRDALWWLDLESGMIKNEVCFDYLSEIQDRKDELGFLDKMVYSNLAFEKSLILLNKDCNLML